MCLPGDGHQCDVLVENCQDCGGRGSERDAGPRVIHRGHQSGDQGTHMACSVPLLSEIHLLWSIVCEMYNVLTHQLGVTLTYWCHAQGSAG